MNRFGTIVLVCVAVVLLVPAFLRSGSVSQLGPGVVVMTPHNEQIRFELGSRFSKWHQREFGTDAHVAWSTPGGTSEIRKLLQSQWKAAAVAGAPFGGDIDLVLVAGPTSTVFWPSPPRLMILSPPSLFRTVSQRKSSRLGSPPTPLLMVVFTTSSRFGLAPRCRALG